MSLPFETAPLFEQYFKWQIEYEKKFGPKTVIFAQVGSFYECYQVFGCGKCFELGDILNIVITSKVKAKEHGPRNPNMIGFPDHSLDKFISKLMQKGWTVVRVDQFDIELKSEKRREITKIYSPSTYIDSDIPTTNYLLGMIIEIIQGRTYIHTSAIDVTTGLCQLVTLYDTADDNSKAFNDLRRMMCSYQPTEIVCNNDKLLREIADCSIHVQPIQHHHTKVSYQKEFLKRIYPNNNILDELARHPDLLVCMIYTCQFAYEHDHSIIQKMSVPEVVSDDEVMCINADGVLQLNLVSDKLNANSLMKTIDYTSTSIGRRLLRERLLRPITNTCELDRRYNEIEKMKLFRSEIKTLLKGVCDIEKKHRKAQLGRLTPREFAGLQTSYSYIVKVFLLSEGLVGESTDELRESFEIYIRDVNSIFDLDMMDKIVHNYTSSVFKPGVDCEIDALQQQINEQRDQLQRMANLMSKHIGAVDAVKIMYAVNDDYHLSTTIKRGDKLKSFPSTKLILTKSKSATKITSKDIKSISDTLKELEKEIGLLTRERYISTTCDLMNKYDDCLKAVVKTIGCVDVVCSNTFAAIKNVYHRPVLADNSKSNIRVKGIRHPIIEKLIDDEYVGNDLHLGKEKNGLLLYGLNSSGKSSLLRAIGCNVVMAQAGMYVACDKMELSVFHDMLCKITCADNLFRSESTFEAETIELRNTLRKANSKSLVLADELSNGTESLSASALVASTVEYLISVESVFMVSTHLHELMDLVEMTENEKLQISHLEIILEKDKINYTRTLKNGSGESLYGLEVASVMGVNRDVMRRAFEFRSRLNGRSNEVVSSKKSRYNADIFMNQCEMCQSSKDLHTHHIREQHTADGDGVINGKFHKNAKHNLMVLCEKCHRKIHH